MNCEQCAEQNRTSMMVGDTVHGWWVCTHDKDHRADMTEPERLRLMGVPTLL